MAGAPGAPTGAEVLYPVPGGARAVWDVGRRELTVMLPRLPSACLLRLT